MREEDKNNLFEHQEKIYKIIFEKRNTRANIKLGIKLSIALIVALIIGGVFSNLIIKYKYGPIIEQLQRTKTNSDMVILDYTSIVNKNLKSVVTIGSSEENIEGETDEGNISGVVVNSSGVILTNYSTIKDMGNIYVKVNDGTDNIYKAEFVTKNENIDAAIIQIKYDGELSAINLADTNDISIGQGIAILGAASGDGEIDNISPGIITSIDDDDYLQVSANISEENTGGPICNSKGELIGLASLNITVQEDNDGFYYGISIDKLEDFINSTDLFKNVLGISDGGIILDENGEYLGFYIEQLQKNGSAYKAGIKPTDIILTVDGVEVESIQDVTDVLNDKKEGESIICNVLSDGSVEKVSITING